MIEADNERARLTRLAYRMLGSWSDAEDIVQQSYERWYRLTPTERRAIERPEAWFTTVASRLCLNLLDSARVRRERYIGPWLPEPVPDDRPADLDPLARITLDDSVSMALLVVLESLTPAERVSYILHEVFELPYAEMGEIIGRSPEAARQAASSARRHLREACSRPASMEEHVRLVDAFRAACANGDLTQLIAVLDPAVVSISDGNGRIGIARQPVVGSDKVARFLLGILRRPLPFASIESVHVNGTPGFALVRKSFRGRGKVLGVIALNVEAGSISTIWIMMNPDKLTAWR